MVSFRKGKPNSKTPYWLKHRTSAQSNYWVAEGRQLVSRIKELERKGNLYGHSSYHRFDTEDAYRARIAELKAQGAKFI